MSDTLLVAEMFYSQQSEGISTGYPAFFIRLAKCNMLCGGINGSLVKEGKATWYCDTIPVWKKGMETSFEDIYNKIKDSCNLDWIRNGRIHLIISGGEPTLKEHQINIINFYKWMAVKCPPFYPFIEIETNGSRIIEDDLYYNILDQINCSPKLSNSGMSENIRINPDVIKQIKQHSNHQFKFVINTEEHMKECIKDFIEPFNLNWKNIILMPGVDCLKDLSDRTREVFEIGKKYGYRAITRSHVLAWDKVTGV